MTTYRLNPHVQAVAAPPIADAKGWAPRAGEALLDVAQALPAEPPAPALTAHLARRVREPDTALYTDILGLEPLRAALAADLSADYEAPVAAGDIGITAGCNQAFCVVMSALAAAGDEVLLPLPCYFNHQMWLEAQGIRPVFLPFRAERGGIPDPDEAAARVGPRTRAVVLITPNNPTGVEYPDEILDAFYELARRHGLALVVDETYKDFRARPGPPHRLLVHPDWRETLVQLHSFSKTYSLAGYRVGAVVAGPALLVELAKLLDCVAICPPHIGQLAALFGLTELGAWRRQRVDALRERLRAFTEAFERAGTDYALVSAGAYFAYLRHPHRGEPAAGVARRLAEEAAVLCLPGSMFGPDQEDYLRFAFANLESARIPELVSRLAGRS